MEKKTSTENTQTVAPEELSEAELDNVSAAGKRLDKTAIPSEKTEKEGWIEVQNKPKGWIAIES